MGERHSKQPCGYYSVWFQALGGHLLGDHSPLRVEIFLPELGATQSIAEHIERASRELVRVEEGSLYPALHRLEHAGLLASEWRESENRRRARYYRLTARGRKQLAVEEERWRRLARGVENVLEFA